MILLEVVTGTAGAGLVPDLACVLGKLVGEQVNVDGGEIEV